MLHLNPRIPVYLSLVLLSACGGGGGTQVYADKAEARTIIETISASGKIQPEVEVNISSDVSGEIVSLFVKEGDSVQEGQLLLEINPEIYASETDRVEALVQQSESNLASAEARLKQAQAQWVQAQAAFKRSKSLYAKEAISTAEWEQAQANYEVAQSEVKAAEEAAEGAKYNVESAQASLKAARENLTRTRILAPMDGVVSRLVVEKGERVVGTAQMTGTEMLRVANLSNMEVSVEVNENDIIKVSLSDTAFIEVDAYTNRQFTGIVTSIANSPVANAAALSTDEVTNFEVKIRILRSSYQDLLQGQNSRMSPFRPGMSASVDIRTERKENVLSVPVGAVTARADSSIGSSKSTYKEFVFLIDSGKVALVEVKTGIQDLKFIEILEGLKVNDQIVAGPYEAISKTLQNGDPVEVMDQESFYNQFMTMPGQP